MSIESNPMCGPGALDRTNPPHCCCKNVDTISHYEGCGSTECLLGLFCNPWYGWCCWEPTLKRQGDMTDPMSDENPICLFGERGQYDRERRPHIATRCCRGPLAIIQYEGCCTLPWFLSGCLGPLYTMFCWEPTLVRGLPKGGMGMIGAPIQVHGGGPGNMQFGAGQMPMQMGQQGQMMQQHPGQPMMMHQQGQPMQGQPMMMHPGQPQMQMQGQPGQPMQMQGQPQMQMQGQPMMMQQQQPQQ